MPGAPEAGRPTRPMFAVECGQVRYEDALRWQRQLVAARAAGEIGDVLLTLTHDPVYTAGRHADVDAHVLGTRGIRVVEVERGGDVTYHGPGQVVVYPIIELDHAKAVRPFVAAMQSAMIRTADSYGITARAHPERVGVWVGGAKLGAIGIKIAGRVTYHGLAFNVDPDLDDFAGIVPCGIADAEVCSLASLGIDTTLGQVRNRLVAHLAEELGVTLQQATPADLGLIATGSSAA